MVEGLKSWSETGRPALFQALEAVCRQIDRDVSAELTEKDKDHKDLLKSLSSCIAKEASLRKQNESLRDELAKFRDASRRNGSVLGANGIASSSTVERQPLGELSPNKATNSSPAVTFPGSKGVTAQSSLQRDYDKLAAKYTAVLQAREQERAALKKRREDCNKWASYCDSLETKIKKLEKELEAAGHQRRANLQGEAGLEASPLKPALAGQAGPETVPRRPSPNSSFNTAVTPAVKAFSHGPPSLEEKVSAAPLILSPERYGNILGQASNDDSTSEDVELPPRPAQQVEPPQITVKQEPSSDGPIIVSERPVRKRKHESVDTNNNEARNGRVKSEHSSSDPVFIEELQQFSPHESIDLDEAGQDDLTPKKRRSNERTIDDEDFLNLRASKRQQMPSSTSTHRRPVNTFIQAEANHPESFNNGSHLRERRLLNQLNQGVKDLAEDDDGLGTSNMTLANPAKSGRLDALLNTPCPDKGPVINRPARPRQSLVHSASFELETPQPRSLPFSRNQGIQTPQTPQLARSPQLQGEPLANTKRTARGSATPGSRFDGGNLPGDSRKSKQLRQLPPSKLSLTDFKINPKFNDGFDFAYSEVVRNKAERQNLVGCVDPECCGKTFRALALLERDGIGPSVMVRAEDIKLLEDYLGANAYRLGSMSREEKEELWLEAKMRELANKHGKHRERYTRRSSPPGFWNTDFPNTQEQQKEREESAKQEQRLVEERYKDAMRGNGRWLFRDE